MKEGKAWFKIQESLEIAEVVLDELGEDCIDSRSIQEDLDKLNDKAIEVEREMKRIQKILKKFR